MNATDRVNRILQDAADLASEVQNLRAENEKLKGLRPNRKKLSAREVEHIRRMSGAHSQRSIAEAFDVNRATVSRIIRRIYWK